MTEPLRLAVCGAGRAFERLYLPALARVPGLRVAAIADPLPERAALGGPGTATYRGLKELLAHEQVEAVLVLTPASRHAADALLAMGRGLPVLVEKPVCLGQDDLGRLEAAGAGQLLRPALSRRWWPVYRRARAAGRGFDRVVFGIRSDPKDWDPIAPEPDVVTDLLPHGFDLVRWLTGAEIVRLRAEKAATAAIAHLELSGGQQATVRASLRGAYIESLRVNGRTVHGGPPGAAASALRRLRRRPDPSAGAMVAMLTAWAEVLHGRPAGDFPAFADARAVAEATILAREG